MCRPKHGARNQGCGLLFAGLDHEHRENRLWKDEAKRQALTGEESLCQLAREIHKFRPRREFLTVADVFSFAKAVLSLVSNGTKAKHRKLKSKIFRCNVSWHLYLENRHGLPCRIKFCHVVAHPLQPRNERTQSMAFMIALASA